MVAVDFHRAFEVTYGSDTLASLLQTVVDGINGFLKKIGVYTGRQYLCIEVQDAIAHADRTHRTTDELAGVQVVDNTGGLVQRVDPFDGVAAFRVDYPRVLLIVIDFHVEWVTGDVQVPQLFQLFELDRNGAGKAIAVDHQPLERLDSAQLLGDGAGKVVVMQTERLQRCQIAEFRWNLTSQKVV